MDAFEEMMKRQRRKQERNILIISILAVMVIILTVCAVLIRWAWTDVSVFLGIPRETTAATEALEVFAPQTEAVDLTEPAPTESVPTESAAAETAEATFVADVVPPVLMMLGEGEMTIEAGEEFIDPGIKAQDNVDGDLTGRVQSTGSVTIYRVGSYELNYYVEDASGNSACATRTVNVIAKAPLETVMPEGKVIYLTFDDGPSSYTALLLEVLKKYDVKATFFVCGTDCIDYLADIAAGGHSIGIHSECHNYKQIYSDEEAYFTDLFRMQDIIEERTGIKTKLVRFPGGSSNTVSSFNEGIMTRLARDLTDMGFQYFDWNVDSNDAGGAKNAKKVTENVIEGILKQDVSIVLQHDVKDYSVEAVEAIICWGLENGYTFAPLELTSPPFHHPIKN